MSACAVVCVDSASSSRSRSRSDDDERPYVQAAPLFITSFGGSDDEATPIGPALPPPPPSASQSKHTSVKSKDKSRSVARVCASTPVSLSATPVSLSSTPVSLPSTPVSLTSTALVPPAVYLQLAGHIVRPLLCRLHTHI